MDFVYRIIHAGEKKNKALALPMFDFFYYSLHCLLRLCNKICSRGEKTRNRLFSFPCMHFDTYVVHFSQSAIVTKTNLSLMEMFLKIWLWHMGLENSFFYANYSTLHKLFIVVVKFLLKCFWLIAFLERIIVLVYFFLRSGFWDNGNQCRNNRWITMR